ncbi:ubiquinol-cytochrome C chaperone family protein [Pontixanthobacter sp. CEM42]|uniref:ubiquinol-cytochrome C chaperone family protein n=1 Tax=Pontixanthobacter sp. CEM42 TaxID=2792077 RepID=UPI001ADEE452|nr:ubiquinol-cytochrome C chaperone family protein [Pontixanthobacter sp. CEM42]
MAFFSRLFGTEADPKEALRPLWHAVVGEARQPHWYRNCGAADTVDGRFDMITNVLAMVMLRMEADKELLPATARLTELFVEDIDGQLRETGLGDPTLGKKMGKLMEAMGGRIGAYRNALESGASAMTDAVRRNVTLTDEAHAEAMAAGLIELSERLEELDKDQLLAGEITA